MQSRVVPTVRRTPSHDVRTSEASLLYSAQAVKTGTLTNCRLSLILIQAFSSILHSRHLIADHLGWFKSTEGTGEGKFRTIEDIMQARGEKVKRGRMDVGGVVEYAE